MTLQALLSGADGVTRSFLTQTYPALASAVAAPIYFAAIIYWALYGYRVYAGHAAVAWRDILAKAVMTFGVFATLNWGGFAQLIYDVFVSFMDSAAGTLMAGQPTAHMLDALSGNVDAMAKRMRDVSFYQFSVLLDGAILFIVNCILFVVALFYMTIAKIGLAITMTLLPLFVGFFFFEQTRQWGMNWINKMLTFCLLYILVVAIVRFGFQAYGDAIDTATQAATAGHTTQLVIMESVLILFMLSVRGWAAALASGASSSTGILMMAMRGALRKGPK